MLVPATRICYIPPRSRSYLRLLLPAPATFPASVIACNCVRLLLSAPVTACASLLPRGPSLRLLLPAPVTLAFATACACYYLRLLLPALASFPAPATFFAPSTACVTTTYQRYARKKNIEITLSSLSLLYMFTVSCKNIEKPIGSK